jgi:hypothetical protein
MDQRAASGAVHRKAEERPHTGRIRAFRQRSEVPQLSSCARQGLRDSPHAHVDAVFALTTTQAKGGDTLVHKNSTVQAFCWKAPATDSGPDVASVKKQLQ